MPSGCRSGKRRSLEGFKHERLKQFYTDWYRPDLMAVVAVGQFDKPVVEGLIKTHFGSIPPSKSPRPRPTYDVPAHPGTLYGIATDKEATSTSVSVYTKMALRDPTSVGAYRQQIVESLFSGLLSARFQEMAQKPDAPFLNAGTGRGLFVRSKEATTLSASVKEDGLDRGLEALFAETERVVRFGFTPTELDRQKRLLLRSLEQAVTEKDTQQSASYAAEFGRNFLQREPIPGIVYENALYQRFIPEITLAEVNGLAKEWSPDGNRVVLVSAPDKPGLVIPDQKRLAAAIAAASSKPLQPYADTSTVKPLLETTPAPGSVVRTATVPEYEITQWELSNGVKVVLKPTTFKQDEVVFRAFSPGGTSLASDKDFVAATTAAQVVQAGGLGSFSAIELQKMMTGKVASATAIIGDTEEMMIGGGSLKDLETMFQLIYARFTQPRADASIFSVITEQSKSALANQRSMPEVVFAEALQGALTQNHFRARPFTPELIDEMSLDRSLAFYKDRYADASDFTFTFVGSFSLDAMKPLVERYLGGLPSLRRKETWKDVAPATPKGVVQRQVDKGIEPKSRAALVFTGPFQYNQIQRIAIRAMGTVLENRLRDVLREDLGGTYSVSVSPTYDKFPREEYAVSIDFGCSPDRTEALIKTVFAEIEKLRASGPTAQQVADVKEGFLRDFEQSTKQNGYLVNQLSLRYQFGEELKEFFSIPDLYRKLDAAAIQQAAKTYLDTNNYVRVTLFPEKKCGLPRRDGPEAGLTVDGRGEGEAANPVVPGSELRLRRVERAEEQPVQSDGRLARLKPAQVLDDRRRRILILCAGRNRADFQVARRGEERHLGQLKRRRRLAVQVKQPRRAGLVESRDEHKRPSLPTRARVRGRDARPLVAQRRAKRRDGLGERGCLRESRELRSKMRHQVREVAAGRQHADAVVELVDLRPIVANHGAVARVDDAPVRTEHDLALRDEGGHERAFDDRVRDRRGLAVGDG